MTTTTAIDVRAEREKLGISRLTLAILSRTSISWLAALEGGMRPRGSRALTRVIEVLDSFESEQTGAMLRNAYELKPDVGVSSYRGDTSDPKAA
jgi:predicted transcriptional regulator